MMNSFIRLALFPIAFTAIFAAQASYGQLNSLDEIDKQLTTLHSKIFPFYYGSQDSLYYYSDLFTMKLTNFIKDNSLTLTHKFKWLTDSNACHVVTSTDGLFRIYSWDTWLGGTMHDFNNIFQFNSNGKIHTTGLSKKEGDFGTYFTDIFTLKANSKTYYLAIGGGSESTKDAYESISTYAISHDTLDDKVKLIKTQSGLNNSISFEYDFFSVVNKPERPIRLIQFDADKQIIYIPVVLENGTVTDRFIRYHFTGQYFEKISNTEKRRQQK